MAISSDDSLDRNKVLTSLTRLKHSLVADREIRALKREIARVGSEGVVPQLESTLSEILGVTNED